MIRALFFLGLLVSTVSVQASARAGDLSESERGAIRAVIEDQLAAFQRDDAIAAFANASPAIQRIFGTPETFMRMVRTDYRPVYRPRVVEFRDIVTDQGAPIQRVFLVGPSGVPVIALYPMQRQGDGTWKINGCTLVRADDTNV